MSVNDVFVSNPCDFIKKFVILNHITYNCLRKETKCRPIINPLFPAAVKLFSQEVGLSLVFLKRSQASGNIDDLSFHLS